MVVEEVEEIVKDIKSLKIQGAHAIAKSAIRAFILQSQKSKAKEALELYYELIETADMVAGARPTEPLLRNKIRQILATVAWEIKKNNIGDAKIVKEILKKKEKSYFEEMELSKERIVSYGAKLVPKNAHVLVHCHSSTVMGIIKKANEIGKNVRVTCTETRPKFQGRISAKELRDSGIQTRLIVDSAVKSILTEIDIVIVGADAITATGDLINKIGTYGIATLSFESDIPFYSATELSKFDPLTTVGMDEPIEERDPSEVADLIEFKGIEIRNPAFDKTPGKYITGYITEEGITPPQLLPHVFSIAREDEDISRGKISKKKRE